jgi:hypothetical protein
MAKCCQFHRELVERLRVDRETIAAHCQTLALADQPVLKRALVRAVWALDSKVNVILFSECAYSRPAIRVDGVL